MRHCTGLLAVVMLCIGCGTAEDDCTYTLTCLLPPGAGATTNTCDGICVPQGTDSDGWSLYPFLLWQSTDTLTQPMCAGNYPRYGFTVHQDPQQSFACETCSCQPPAGGSCSLPPAMTAD